MTHTLLFISGGDMTIIFAVALLLFGGKKLPELARGLGMGIKEFKDATNGTAPEAAKPASPVAEQAPQIVVTPEIHHS